MRFQLKNAIEFAEPFIYEVGGNFYYLGFGIFRECTDDEIKLYKDFQTEWSNVRRIEYLSKQNTQAVVELHDRIVKYPKCTDNDTIKDERVKVLAKLTDDDIIEILRQKDALQEIYFYKQGRFK